jgi:hypothetical protein
MSQLTDLANLASAYKTQCENGDLSASEYKELINDLKIADAINTSSSNLEEDITAQSTLNACLMLASSIL